MCLMEVCCTWVADLSILPRFLSSICPYTHVLLKLCTLQLFLHEKIIKNYSLLLNFALETVESS